MYANIALLPCAKTGSRSAEFEFSKSVLVKRRMILFHIRFFDVERTFPRVSRTQQNISNINEYIWEVDI